jgi:hypothetical protein
MRQGQALLACAAFALALLAEFLLSGNAYAQHAAESGSQDFVFRFSIFVLARIDEKSNDIGSGSFRLSPARFFQRRFSAQRRCWCLQASECASVSLPFSIDC